MHQMQALPPLLPDPNASVHVRPPYDGQVPLQSGHTALPAFAAQMIAQFVIADPPPLPVRLSAHAPRPGPLSSVSHVSPAPWVQVFEHHVSLPPWIARHV